VTAGAGCHDTVLTFQRRGQTITSDVVECSIEPSFVGRATVDVRLGDGDDLGRLGPGHGEQASAWQVFIHGGAGADELYDEPGSLYTGRVRLLGDGGNDLVSLKYSGRSGDYGEGGLGRDTLLGGAGADTLVGGGGRDSFAAGRGADKVAAKDHLRDLRIDCGPGADQLAFDATLDPPAVSC
jgi:Ca2+-binding RTX toxin-like protein